MSTDSKIEWTERTWNPSVGCTKISAGCKHCYAETMARRLKAMGVEDYRDGFALKMLPHRLDEPLHRKKPTMYFVNSMSDLFHEKVTFEFIDRVIDIIRQTPQHTYQILTKRPARMRDFFSNRPVPDNAWLGVSVENRRHGLPRIPELQAIKAAVRFLSVEPLLEGLGTLNLDGIDWVIVGGESGHGARPMKKAWALSVRNQCLEANVAFFFKQWGQWGADGVRRSKKANGRTLDGRIWDQFPQLAQA